MKLKLISAPTRLTLGLLSLSVSVWLMAVTLGLLPNPRRTTLQGRIAFCEEAAVFCSLLAARNDFRLITASLELLVSNNEEIASAALRRQDGLLLAEIGDHTRWSLPPGSVSTDDQMRVPIMAGVRTWGHIEVRFHERPTGPLGRWSRSPLVLLLLFAGSSSYLLYYLYLRKMLKNLDPSKVVPSRVRATLDTFAEGLLVLDNQDRIVLANRAFGEAMHLDSQELVGRAASQLPWKRNPEHETNRSLPWNRAVASGQPQIGELLTVGEGEERRFFKVNACPILSDKGQQRGALASFDDVTDLENKKSELLGMLERLKESQSMIRQQNQELQLLVTVDPLTGCRNRRALFQEFEQLWQTAVRYSQPLSCVMVDIDHFKSINDKHGHATGDEVLRAVSRLLRETVRSTDIVGRFGGEEFCLVLPQLTAGQARQAAERFRQVIADLRLPQTNVTASFGVSSIELGATSLQEMLEQADKALYVAKRGGRNRVVSFDEVTDVQVEAAGHDSADSSKEGDGGVPSADQIPYAAVASLLAALAYRDPDTAAHSTRVADLCVATARELMSVHDAYILEVAALLHDIGKIGVPDNILLKPGPLTREEWEVMSLHDRIGCEIVDASFNCPALTEIVRYHHFAFGGNPHTPNVRCGPSIPLGARILTISDAFDAMVSNRVYRAGRSHEEAFAELRRCAGAQFDPDLVAQFIKTVSEGRSRGPAHRDSISRQLALQLGVQAERLAQAVDLQDYQAIKALARYLEATAAKYGVDSMRAIAARLQLHCDGEPDLKEIVHTTYEIVDLCRSAQRAHIDIDPELSAAPAAGRRNIFERAALAGQRPAATGLRSPASGCPSPVSG